MQPLEFYNCYTLFDLSNKRNLNTMLQVIGLRAQPILIREPKVIQADLSFYSFGNRYSGLAKIWELEFGIEAKGAFREGEDPVAAPNFSGSFNGGTVVIGNFFASNPFQIDIDKFYRLSYATNSSSIGSIVTNVSKRCVGWFDSYGCTITTSNEEFVPWYFIGSP